MGCVMQKRRTVMCVVLTVLGIGLIAYGLHSQAAGVSSDRQSQAAEVSESAVTPVVSQGDANSVGSEEVKKTAAQPTKPAAPAKPAAACPT